MKSTKKLRRLFELTVNNSKVLSILGLCKKSGNLTLGFDACTETIKQKKSYLILITQDLSDKTKQKLYNQLNGNLIYTTDLTMNDIHDNLGKSCGIISINDKGFAKKIKSLLNLNTIGGNQHYDG